MLLFFTFVQSYSKFMLKKPAEKEIARIGPSKNPAPHDFPIFLQSALELIIFTYFNYNRLVGGSPQSNRNFQKKSQDTLSQVDKYAKCLVNSSSCHESSFWHVLHRSGDQKALLLMLQSAESLFFWFYSGAFLSRPLPKMLDHFDDNLQGKVRW